MPRTLYTVLHAALQPAPRRSAMKSQHQRQTEERSKLRSLRMRIHSQTAPGGLGRVSGVCTASGTMAHPGAACLLAASRQPSIPAQ